MIPAIIRNQRAGGHRYISAMPMEFQQLFGYPPPIIPQGEQQPQTGEVIQAVMPSELETLAGRYLENLRKTFIEADLTTKYIPLNQEAEKAYGLYLGDLIRHVILSDRRIGLLNLFWLAHLKTMRKLLLTACPPDTKVERLKYRIWPVFSGFLQRIQRNVLSSLSPHEKRQVSFNLGRDFNWGLIDSLLGDQFSLTENDVRSFNAGGALDGNAHFRLDGETFDLVMNEIARRFRLDTEKNDTDYLKAMRRRMSGFEAHMDYLGQERVGGPFLHHPEVLGYYLGAEDFADDLGKGFDHTIARLGGWCRFTEEFLRLVQALQRSEYCQFFQEFITLIPAGLDDSDIKELFLEGRLYKYSLNLPVVNNFRRVVILFADIREFTRTSEMAISERELTERLYEVFDPLVHIVASLGGTVDKFTGDGMMITFGAVRSAPDMDLRALRCAIAIQEAVERLRKAGRTVFQMGLSIHSGRVFVANFMHDDRTKETTVIGRQVNLAARISSTQSLHPDDESPALSDDAFRRQRESLRTTSPSAPGAVFMDQEGNFYNVGLATSTQFVQDLRKIVGMEPCTVEGKRGYRFHDKYLRSHVIFHYTGDAHFKGFRETIPVYGISWERGSAAEEPAPAGTINPAQS